MDPFCLTEDKREENALISVCDGYIIQLGKQLKERGPRDEKDN